MKRALRLISVAAALLPALCACNVLFTGRFSSDLGQAVAYADLSEGVSAYDAPAFSLSVVTTGDTEYVLLFSPESFDAAAAHLYVLSSSLAVLNAYTLEQIETLDPAGVAFAGDAAMWRLTDETVVVGNVEAKPTDSGLTLTRKLAAPSNPVAVTLSGWAIEGPSTADYTWTGFSDDPSSKTFSYTAYAADLGSSSTITGNLGKSAEMVGAFTDPTDAEGNSVLLAFSVDEEGTCYFLQVAKTPDLAGGFAGYTLLSDYSSFTKQDLNAKSIHATHDGIVAYRDYEGAWVWFTPSDPGTEKSMYVSDWSSDSKVAFSFSNDWYCVWDPEARTLIRYQTWW